MRDILRRKLQRKPCVKAAERKSLLLRLKPNDRHVVAESIASSKPNSDSKLPNNLINIVIAEVIVNILF